jgi:hypothetical protein
VLLLLVACSLLWVFLSHHTSTHANMVQVTATPAVPQNASLQAVGVTLGYTSHPAAITQQQAEVLAQQFAPDATDEHAVKAQYVALNYDAESGGKEKVDIANVPVWMITYQQITASSTYTSIDPKAPATLQHNLYVFVDAQTGKELLSIWA